MKKIVEAEIEAEIKRHEYVVKILERLKAKARLLNSARAQHEFMRSNFGPDYRSKPQQMRTIGLRKSVGAMLTYAYEREIKQLTNPK
jgi:tRNA A37 threonylcarbamoyladenosine dehydratase